MYIPRKLSPALALLALLALFVTGPSLADVTEIPYCPRSEAPCQTADVTLANGSKVCGLNVKGKSVSSFRGIPFAQADRWADPEPAPPWQETLEAVDFGPVCPQLSHIKNNDCATGSCLLVQSENCLSLNVWTPATDSGKRPVLLYIYGGGFIEGGSAPDVFDGAALAEAGNAVVVSFNYRLGALGFMVAPQYKHGTHSGWKGNFGFLDQREAMIWVKNNISAFGGDPNRVTIFGESAGAMSVGLHSTSAPASRPYFQAAIMESNPLAIPYKNVEESKPFFRDLAREVGCKGTFETDKERIECLTRRIRLTAKTQPYVVNWRTILKAQGKVEPTEYQIGTEHLKEFLVWTPVIDNTNIVYEPMEAIANHKPTNLPMIIGTNRNEGLLFAEGVEDAAVLAWEKKHHKPCNTLDPNCGFTNKDYETLLKAVFPQSFPDAYGKIISNDRYKPAGSSDANGAQLANVLTDYLFTCANHFFVKSANKPIFAYQFNQPPHEGFYLDIWPQGSACRTSGAGSPVCHGAELPYVFNSFEEQWCPAGGVPGNTEALAKTMSDYWVKFATYPHGGPGLGWSAYTSDADYIRFATQISHGAPLQGKADTAVDCSFWDNLHPDENWKSYDLFAPRGD